MVAAVVVAAATVNLESDAIPWCVAPCCVSAKRCADNLFFFLESRRCGMGGAAALRMGLGSLDKTAGPRLRRGCAGAADQRWRESPGVRCSLGEVGCLGVRMKVAAMVEVFLTWQTPCCGDGLQAAVGSCVCGFGGVGMVIWSA